MRFIERARIAASPEACWVHIGDPERWPGFHPKVASAERRSGSVAGPEAWYDIAYRLGQKSLLHRARIVEYRPPSHLRLEATCSIDGRREAQVTIAYTLVAKRQGVDVLEQIDVKNHRMPWWLSLLIAVFHRVGTPKGPSGLEVLKHQLEAGAGGAPAEAYGRPAG